MNLWSTVACAAIFAASTFLLPAQETTHITGFDYTLYSAEFDLAGQHVLVASSGSPYGEAAEFDIISTEEVSTVQAHPNFTYDAVYQPGGPGFITGGFDGLVIFWHPESNDTLVGHTGDVLCLDWKNSSIASGARDNSARVWDAGTFEELFVFDQHLGPVNGVALSQFGDFLATACADGIVRVFDLSDGSLKYELQGHFGAITDVVFSPDDSKLVSTSTDLSAKVWDMASGNEVASLPGHNGEVTAVDWVEDFIATSCGDAIVRVFDAETFDEIHALSGHLGRVSDVSIAPRDPFRLVSIGADKQCIVWYLENEALTTNTILDRQLNFGSVEIDEFRDTTLWLVNNTSMDTPLDEAIITPVGTPFTVTSGLPDLVPAMDSVSITLRYDPTEIEVDSARLTITTASRITPFILTLNGMGAEPTSVADTDQQLHVYPNPANGVVFVQLPTDEIVRKQSLKVVDLTGNVVMQQDLEHYNDDVLRIETQRFTPGTYILQLGEHSAQIRIVR